MKSYNFSYRNLNRTSQLFNDYVEGASELRSFYNLRPDLNNWEYQGSLKVIETRPPINEAEKVRRKNRMNDKILFFNIFILYMSYE